MFKRCIENMFYCANFEICHQNLRVLHHNFFKSGKATKHPNKHNVWLWHIKEFVNNQSGPEKFSKREKT